MIWDEPIRNKSDFSKEFNETARHNKEAARITTLDIISNLS